ncbi:hypothetical protein PTTG_28111 [Puccinia triticina 1-1 BBBD Race 1]|uniref:Chitin synthase export chaperone n=1 Tax=Puccinia triticina (isolate 1-1 / race 1 (BBBD)) TaxID=630390 RepID=A0A180GEI0_PUCT1|nr:hypothetical protein PTTG_28111 [Puccinia triticina 1-1 BBBD Race 1]
MILHIRSKYTAVGRKEIVHFFYFYAFVTLSSFLDSGLIPSSSKIYPYFAAFKTGMLLAPFWCLPVNSFVGFQFAEDSLQGSCLAVFSLKFFVEIATFNSLASFSSSQPTALWIIMYIFNRACVAIYVILQLLLVVRTLDDRWPIGDILFGLGFFVVGLVLIYGFSLTICSAITHYVNGLFFSQLCFLLAVMMVYKNSSEAKQVIWHRYQLCLGSRFKYGYPMEGLFGGALLCFKGSGIVCFHDGERDHWVQRIEVKARDVFCSALGEHVAIAGEELLGILRFNQQAYSEFLAEGGELGDNGVEAAIDLLHELPEVVQTRKWVGDCLIFQLGVPEEDPLSPQDALQTTVASQTIWITSSSEKSTPSANRNGLSNGITVRRRNTMCRVNQARRAAKPHALVSNKILSGCTVL